MKILKWIQNCLKYENRIGVFLCILLFLPFYSFSQATNQNNNKFVIGTSESIHSEVLNEDREFLIYVPNANSGSNIDKIRYPVLYLLDGESFFHSVTGIVQYLSAIGKMPEMIVVAIVNTDRIRDFTPTHSTLWSNGEEDTARFRNSGGGKNFISFIQSEIIPYVDSHYPTEPYRILSGHSLGGLMVLHTLINHPSLFNAYIAIDPSLWWDKHSIIKQSELGLKQQDFKGKKLYFASANTMNMGMDTIRVVKDTAIGNLHVRDNINFKELLEKNRNTKLEWSWKYYAGDNHQTIPLIAESDALRSFFINFELPIDLQDTSINVEYILKHFHRISETLGYKILPTQSTVNYLGYINMTNKNYKRAFEFFQMNIDNYPVSANAFDSMGDFYFEVNKITNAIESYKKALSLQEKTETRRKLEKLEKKK